MSDRAISGLRTVPFKIGTGPIEIMYEGWADVLTAAEGDDGWTYMAEGTDFWPSFSHMVETRIVRIESTLHADYRFAWVEVSGLWVNGDGDRITLKGLAA